MQMKCIMNCSLAGVLQFKMGVVLVLSKEHQQFIALQHFQSFHELFATHSRSLDPTELPQQALQSGRFPVFGLIGQQKLPQFVGQLFHPLLQGRTPPRGDDVQVDDARLRVSGSGKSCFLHQSHRFLHVLFAHLVRETHAGKGLAEPYE